MTNTIETMRTATNILQKLLDPNYKDGNDPSLIEDEGKRKNRLAALWCMIALLDACYREIDEKIRGKYAW